jgi:hypothetical protein
MEESRFKLSLDCLIKTIVLVTACVLFSTKILS